MTTTLTEGTWDTTFDQHLRTGLRVWAERNGNALQEAIAEFTKQASGDGWYGPQSPFTYALRWRGEDIAKGEVTSWVAALVVEYLEHDVPGTEVMDLVAGKLTGLVHEGLRSQSTSLMSNTMDTLRGRAASEFGNTYSSGWESCRWEAHFNTMRDLVNDEQAGVDKARSNWREVRAKLNRAKADSTKERLQNQLNNAVALWDEAVDEYLARMQAIGGPMDAPVLDRSY